MSPSHPKYQSIPNQIDEQTILNLIQEGQLDGNKGKPYLKTLKDSTLVSDKEISRWLGVSERTYANYKQAKSLDLKPQLQESVLKLLAVIKHGTSVFGSAVGFHTWITNTNFFFDNKRPLDFMTTSSGLKFIDDRLTAIEYGDNV